MEDGKWYEEGGSFENGDYKYDGSKLQVKLELEVRDSVFFERWY